MLATLLLSTGAPMLTAGDERWRTQRGNNNAYCQDNGVSWLDWTLPEEADGLPAFTARLLELRGCGHAPGRDRFFSPADVQWWHPDGRFMGEADWHDPDARTLGMLGSKGWLLVLHSDPDPVSYLLPDVALTPVLDSGQPDGVPSDAQRLAAGATLTVPGRTALLLLAT
jgi:glycogen operon protein